MGTPDTVTTALRPRKRVALVTVSRAGVVSIIREITEAQAETLKQKLMFGWCQGPGPHGRMCSDGDIVECHVI